MNLLRTISVLFILAASSLPEQEFAIVTRVKDGDTVVFDDGRCARLTGIDTPEFKNHGEHRKADPARALRASEELERLVLGKKVRLETDIDLTDTYDRYLYYIWIDDTLINLQMVENGFAKKFPFYPNFKYRKEIAEAEARAKRAKMGFWSDQS